MFRPTGINAGTPLMTHDCLDTLYYRVVGAFQYVDSLYLTGLKSELKLSLLH